MEQPTHDLRPFQASTAVATERRTVSIGIVVLIHVVAIYALATGLASQLVMKGEQIIKAQIVKEAPPKLPKTPPPPPPELKKPPPPFIPPPDINLQLQQTAPTITQVTHAITPPPPPKPVKAAPPAITAPASIGRPHECQSKYPPMAIRMGHSGSVLLGFTINPDGSVSNVHVLKGSGHEELDRGAVSCAQDWHYKPALQNGKPVAVPWKTKVDYKLNAG